MNASTKANLIFVAIGAILLIPIYLILIIVYFTILRFTPNADLSSADIGIIIVLGLLIEYILWVVYRKYLKAKVMESLK